MSKIRGKNTKPERILRKALYARGFRYRLHVKDLPGKPDIVLRKDNQIIIADTKWKRLNTDERHAGVSQSDMYQMYAYGKRYAENGEECAKQKVRAVHLIYPRREEVVENEYSDHKGLRVKIDLFDFDKPGADSQNSVEREFIKNRLLNGSE